MPPRIHWTPRAHGLPWPPALRDELRRRARRAGPAAAAVPRHRPAVAARGPAALPGVRPDVAAALVPVPHAGHRVLASPGTRPASCRIMTAADGRSPAATDPSRPMATTGHSGRSSAAAVLAVRAALSVTTSTPGPGPDTVPAVAGGLPAVAVSGSPAPGTPGTA